MKIYEAFNLKNYNSYRLDATCRKAYFPEKEEDVAHFFKSEANSVLLGSGHNVILSKTHYEEAFLIMDQNFGACIVEGNVIEAEAGISMLEMSELALEKGLSGVEMFYDIPSSLGGAVVMNAGASGEEIKDSLIKVRYLDLSDMLVKEISREEIGFEYRNSFFQRNKDKIVLKAWLRLVPKSKEEIKAKMDSIKTARWAKQPKEYPNAGSVFKRPEGRFVGPMLDELGLKGFTIGGAQVSEKHSGFIINSKNATGKDILTLIEHIQAKVQEKFNVNLTVEQRII